MTQPFRILRLDGGGLMGAFAASALATFGRATGRRIVVHCHLITGTSTGGIIAIGLAIGAVETARLGQEGHPPTLVRDASVIVRLARPSGISFIGGI